MKCLAIYVVASACYLCMLISAKQLIGAVIQAISIYTWASLAAVTACSDSAFFDRIINVVSKIVSRYSDYHDGVHLHCVRLCF